MALQQVLLILLRSVAVVAGKGHLIVHVGLHKTSSTSTQQFLYARRIAVQRAHPQLRIGAATSTKSGAFIPITLMSEGACGGQGSSSYDNPGVVAKQLGEIKKWLRQGKTVLVSGEAFDRVSGRCLKQFVDDTGAKTSTAIVVLREPTSWLRSHWQVLMHHVDYQSFQAWMLEERDVNVASPFTTIQNVKQAFDEVDILSYDYMLQLGHTVASYVVCNASLRITQESSWIRCAKSVDDNVHNSNPSNPPIYNDLIRYAHTAHKILGCKGTLKNVVHGPALAKLVESLPTTCDNKREADTTTSDDRNNNSTTSRDSYFATGSNSYFSHIFQESWDSWLTRDLNISTPVHSLDYTPSPICIIDDARLTSEHWANIIRLYIPTSCKPH